MGSKALCIGLGLFCALLVFLPGCQGTSGEPVPVNESNFENVVLKSKGPVLVDFSATWCGPCRQMEPIVEELTGEFKGKGTVARVDIDESRRLAQRYQVDAIPCFIVFKGGQEVGRRVGMASRQELSNLLNRAQ